MSNKTQNSIGIIVSIVALAVSLIASIGGVFAWGGKMQNRVENHTSQIKDIKDTQSKQWRSLNDGNRKSDELIINMKTLMRHQGLEYQSAK